MNKKGQSFLHSGRIRSQRYSRDTEWFNGWSTVLLIFFALLFAVLGMIGVYREFQ